MNSNEINRVSIVALGLSISIFFLITYVICITLGFFWPEWGLHQPWLQFFPGFEWLTAKGFVIGLVESVLYGWYVAAVLGGLFNFFSR